MKIVYGTTNESKVNYMRTMVRGLNIQIVSLKNCNIELPSLEETGTTPLENARIKALAYYKVLGIPVFSCDSGLYFDDVHPDDQPGAWIRRIHGRELSDEEMILYYSELARKYGGKLIAQYRNAISMIIDKNTQLDYEGDVIASEKFYLVSKPHKRLERGFPLNSLAMHIQSRQYYFDMKSNKEDDVSYNGFRHIFIKALSLNIDN